MAKVYINFEEGVVLFSNTERLYEYIEKEYLRTAIYDNIDFYIEENYPDFSYAFTEDHHDPVEILIEENWDELKDIYWGDACDYFDIDFKTFDIPQESFQNSI